MIILSCIWFLVSPCLPISIVDSVMTESIISLYNRKTDKRKNAFSDSRDC